MQVCVPVFEPMSGVPRISSAGAARDTRVISLVHIGPYDTLGEAYHAIRQLHQRPTGLVAIGPPREFYLTQPNAPADQITTLVEQPII